ncbi:MAG: endonuclease V [Promethearchaeota archaeon]
MNKEILKHPLLQDNYTIEQAEALQIKWKKNKDEIEKQLDSSKDPEDIRWIAAVDISFPKIKVPTWGLACAVLWDYQKNEMITFELVKGDLNFSYVPGFLGFRENKLIARTILNLPKKPDILMCDGYGIAHPRKFGEAVHLGVVLMIPSFGVAKNPFHGYSNWKQLLRKRGERTPIWEKKPENIIDSSRDILGYAICLANDRKPVFISQGFSISLENAVKIALDTTFHHRQPEPLFLADQISRKELKN